MPQTELTHLAMTAMDFDRKRLTDSRLLELYKAILLPRLVEEKMLILLRQGVISKWFSGIGQEAISVGTTMALTEADYILPLHRNLGIFTSRGLPLDRLMAQWLGKPKGYTAARDRSFHFADLDSRIIGMISHLGAMLPVADGLALASNLDGDDYIAVAFIGDGGTSEGDFHEALNVASVWDLPVLFVIENNGYGLSTPTPEQYNCINLADRAKGYGMKGKTIDGNNVLEVYHTVQRVAKRMRKDRQPFLLECDTFRMRGHEEASGTKYVPDMLFDLWGQKDPVANFEAYLLELGILTETQQTAIRTEMVSAIQQAVNQATQYAKPEPNLAVELGAVFAPVPHKETFPEALPPSSREIRLVDAISEALYQAMEIYPHLVLMGQDIAEYGGVFKVTAGFVDAFGKERVRNTPICESSIVGVGLGLSLAGKPAMVEMQFADFVACGFNQIVNNLAKTHYRWGHAPQVVVRMPTGGGVGAGPFHSQSSEAWFTHVPGLKVVFPATPADAKGLLLASFADGNPVLFFEHKALYRSVQGPVPEEVYQVPIGKGRLAKQGSSITIVTYGQGVHWALTAVEELQLDAEIVDLRSLIPWDQELVFQSVRKTGKCLVLYEASYTGGFGGEIAAAVGESCFEWLDGPVMRVAALDMPIPFAPGLEKLYLPIDRLRDKLIELDRY